MRKIFLFLIVVFAFSQTHAQYVHKIKADSVLITNDSCTAELNLENSTKHIKGFLYNKGNGRTEFRKVVKLNDSMFIFGGDTLVIQGAGNLNLQQVTTNGNTTTHFINANGAYYQRGLPVLHATDSMLRVGYNAGLSNTSGTGNTAVGNGALQSNTTGTGNTALGYHALNLNTVGTYNVAIGFNGLQSNVSGYDNVAIGRQTLMSNTTGGRNIGIGRFALLGITSGVGNIGIGYSAGGAVSSASYITAIGYEALPSNSTGFSNTAIGRHALYSNNNGSRNTAVGAGAIEYSSGSDNTAVGSNAGLGSTTGSGSANTNRNTAVGSESLDGTGSRNTAVGASALGGHCGSDNTAVGDSALALVKEHNNTAIGKSAGANITYGWNNLAIGYRAFVPVATDSFQLSLGNLIYGTGLNGIDNTISNGKIGIKTKTPAYELDVNGKLGVRTIDSTSSAANMLYQDAATGEIKKAAFGGAGWLLSGNAGTNPATNFFGTIDSQDVAIRTNNAERVRVSTNGKVGIGTANPLYKMDMRGSTDSSYTMIHLSRETTDNGGYIGISQHPVLLLSADASPNSYNGNWMAKGTSAAMMSIAAGNNLNPNFGFFVNSGLTPGTSFSPFSIMQMNGGDAYGSMRGVGIGTTVSWHRLHVQNADSNVMGLRNTAALSASSGAMLRMYNSGTPSASDQRLGALAWGTGASITGMRTGARIQSFSEAAWTDNASHPTYLTFETANNNSTTPEERMRITAAGNVGIGTSTPNKKLHIIGQGLFSDTITAQKNVSVAGNIDITQGVINMTTTGISPHININGNQNGWPRIVITNVANTVSAGAGSLYVNNAGHSLQQYVGASINAFVPAGALIRSNGPGGMAIVADSGVIAFGKDPHIGINEFARFLTNGNFGIGTQTPAYKLDVNGKLGVRTIDSTASAANVLYQDAATGEIKKAAYTAKQTFAQTATGSVTGTNEATLIASGTGDLTIPASGLTVGKSYKVTVYGVYSTDASNPSNLTLRLKFGSVTIASSGAIFLGSGKSNVPFTLQATITCRSTGSSGTVYTFGNVFRDGNVNPITNGTSASTINTTASQTLDVTGQLSDSSSGNVVSAYIVTLESIN